MRSIRRAALLTVLLGGAMAGCGQRGPLVLPDDARPIERLPPPSPESAQPQADDEERRNER